MGVRESRERESVRAETILIGHDDQSVTPAGELAERGEHTRHEAYLGERVDLGVRGLLNQRAVTVEEKCRAPHVQASSSQSFSPGVPTLIRSASESPG